MEASKIVEHLFQGSKPNEEDPILKLFDIVVLAANEYQPEMKKIKKEGVKILHVPLNDYPELGITEDEKHIALIAGQIIADHLDARPAKDILVTCAAGINRSGLLNAIALQKSEKHKMSPDEAIATIRRARPKALFNESFVEFLQEEVSTRKEKA